MWLSLKKVIAKLTIGLVIAFLFNLFSPVDISPIFLDSGSDTENNSTSNMTTVRTVEVLPAFNGLTINAPETNNTADTIPTINAPETNNTVDSIPSINTPETNNTADTLPISPAASFFAQLPPVDPLSPEEEEKLEEEVRKTRRSAWEHSNRRVSSNVMEKRVRSRCRPVIRPNNGPNDGPNDGTDGGTNV